MTALAVPMVSRRARDRPCSEAWPGQTRRCGRKIANDGYSQRARRTGANLPQPVDTLCCGTLGGIEFFCEAADALGRDDLRDLAAQRLTAVLDRAAATGDYRWNNGKRQFNLGLFRGLAGVGYTLLRRLDAALPNVLIWE